MKTFLPQAVLILVVFAFLGLALTQPLLPARAAPVFFSESTAGPDQTFTPEIFDETATATPPADPPAETTPLPPESPPPDRGSPAPLLTPGPPDLAPLPVTITPTVLITLPLPAIDPGLAAIPPARVLLGEVLYDGLTPTTEGDEFIEVCNPNPEPVNLTGYKVGNEPIAGGSGSMYQLGPDTILPPETCMIVAKNAAQFIARFGISPHAELVVLPPDYSDSLLVPNLAKYHAWGSGTWSLSNPGDELLILGPGDEIIDKVSYGNGDYSGLAPDPGPTAPEPYSLHRIWPVDTDSMAHDFVRALPSPGSLTGLPAPPDPVPAPASLPDGMKAYWGQLHGHTSYSDGSGPPFYALAHARAAGLHFYAITDPGHWLSPGEWAGTQSDCAAATKAGQFVALSGSEWDHPAEGHLTVLNNDTWLDSTNPGLDTLAGFYDWLAAHPTTVAQFNHPASGLVFNGFALHPAITPQVLLQEIGSDSVPGYETAFVQSLAHGWTVAPTFSSEGRANWGAESSIRTGLVAPALTAADLTEALRARRVFATADSNLALALRLNGAWMGSILSATGVLPLSVALVDPDIEPITLVLYDRNLVLATVPLTSSTGEWKTQVNAGPGHYFWVKATQADGHVAYTAPIWITGQAPPDPLFLNEVLPSPRSRDWDNNGIADSQDEWFELYNPAGFPLALGGWQVIDASGHSYSFPLEAAVPAGGFATFYRQQTDLALNNDAETITLVRPDGTPADLFEYVRNPGADGSWCRLPDQTGSWSDTCEPSPAAANRARVPAGPLSRSIYEAKRLTVGAEVKVKGHVTAPPGLLGTRNMYIQDHTAGILIYLPKDHRLTLNPGDKIEVVGKLKIVHEEFEIAVSERGDIRFLEPGQPPPPLPIVTTSLLEPYEGMLVMLQGQAVRFEGYTTFWIDDGTGPARTYLQKSTGIGRPYLTPGTPITAVGIVSQYSTGTPSREDYRLLPRYPTDLIFSGQKQLPAFWPVELPDTGF